ncbi:MAG: hypothetical protein R3D62_06045 [Xanthobacteraceae bacterium]
MDRNRCAPDEPKTSSGRQVGAGQVTAGIAAGLLAVGIAALLARKTQRAVQRSPTAPAVTADRRQECAPQAQTPAEKSRITVRAGRRLNRAAGILAFSVLADSAVEHYRGSFNNRAMVIPLAVSSLALAVSAHGLADRRQSAARLRHAIYIASSLTGLLGAGFHFYNVAKRPGAISWHNLMYGAPLGAPIAMLLSGLLGAIAERVRDTRPGQRPRRVLGIPVGRGLAAVTSAGLLGTTAEAGLLHFRGAYHNPFMVLPVTLPPVASGLLAARALSKKRDQRRFTRWWLRLTAATGLAGSIFHAYGVQRNMGGWRNWRQNILNGPPLPAPPSFTGLALAGLAALSLIQDHPDA